jgi:hypothetical protein
MSLYDSDSADFGKDREYSGKHSPGPARAGLAGPYACCSRKRCASSAAMQPVPALVMAWR